MTQFEETPSGVLVPKGTVDGLANVVSGLGMSSSKRSHNQFAYEIAVHLDINYGQMQYVKYVND